MMWAQFPTWPKHPSTKLSPACKPGSRGNEFPILLSGDEPKPELSSSSQAKLEYFNFRAETELTVFYIYPKVFKNCSYFG